MVDNEKEIAVIFRRKLIEDMVTYYPAKVVEGNLLDEGDGMTFVDENGNIYFHLYSDYRTNCFGFRESKAYLGSKYADLPYNDAKKAFLADKRKSLYYSLYIDGEIVIFDQNLKTKYVKTFEDIDSLEMGYVFDESISFESDSDGMGDNKQKKEKEIVDLKGLNLVDKKNKNSKRLAISINKKELKGEINKKIIGQEEAIKKILTAVYEHYDAPENERSNNIFCVGPTGVGKTEIFRIISNYINVPMAIVDANEYTVEGYVGSNVSEMLESMINAANGDVELAQKGILIIDEIDKLIPYDTANPAQVKTVGVQQALLKLVEDGVYNINYKGKKIDFNTRQLLVVALGAFSKITEEPREIIVGFEKEISHQMKTSLTINDVRKSGIIPELIGRFPIFINFNDLNEDDLCRIIKESELSELKKVKSKLLERKKIDLLYDDEVIKSIAKQAIKLQIGARSLNNIIIKILNQAMDEITDDPEAYQKLTITSETVEDPKKYLLEKR